MLGREEGIESQFLKDALQEHMGEDFWVSEAVRASFLHGKLIVLCRISALAVGFKGGDERSAVLEGFFKTLDIARQSVIKAVQRPDIEKDLFLRDFFASLVCDPDRLNQKARKFFVKLVYSSGKLGIEISMMPCYNTMK